MAKLGGKIWKELGALAYVECVADDVSVGRIMSFPRSVRLKKDEVVVLSWIVYCSRAAPDPDEQEGHERSAHGEVRRARRDAVRRQADDHSQWL